MTTVDGLMEHFGCVTNLYILFSCLLFWNVIFCSVIENIIYATAELLSGNGLKQIVDGCLMLHMQTKAGISVLTECLVPVSGSTLKLMMLWIDCLFLCVFKRCDELEWQWRTNVKKSLSSTCMSAVGILLWKITSTSEQGFFCLFVSAGAGKCLCWV